MNNDLACWGLRQTNLFELACARAAEQIRKSMDDQVRYLFADLPLESPNCRCVADPHVVEWSET